MSRNDLQNRVRETAPDSYTDCPSDVVGAGVVVAAFLAWLESRHGAPRSIVNRGRALHQFTAFLASQGIAGIQEVTPETLAQYWSHLQERNLSPNTIESYLVSVRRLFAWMAEQCMIFENPAENLRPPRAAPAPARTLTQAEVTRLLDSTPARRRLEIRDRAVLEVLYVAGLTAGEFVGLELADVNLREGTIRVRTRQARVVPLTRSAVHRLGNYIETARPRLHHPAAPTERLWLSKYRAALSQDGLLHILAAAARRAGIQPPLSVHLLRRSRAQHLLRHGVAPRDVAKAFGLREPAEWFKAIGAQEVTQNANNEK
ncbi:MAG: hypothetical protein A3K18_25735 [Lentisphaerae bacterium RIFOXYA12_64_32]|nr:MAG: hypothetical protein A3K18_25735 [Lentisphaerae bacterium RIFOXYA12_64_32]